MRTREQEIAAHNYLSVKTMAERMACSPDKVKRMIRAGEIKPAINIGTPRRPLYRVAPEVFEAFLASSTVSVAA